MSGSLSGTIVGSGSDSIVVKMSEDSAAGSDAQFTVNVDGQQIGGRQTVTASHANGQDQTFTFLGNYGAGQHSVTVTFANNFLLPGQSGDRNVFVNSLTYDGQSVSNSTTPIYESPLFPPNSDHNIFGNAVFTVNDNTGTSDGNSSTTPGAVSVGSGNDTLVLNMAEDEYQGDAQFTIKVDGVQVGGTQTTTAHLAEGQQQEFDVHGNWGSGNHDVTISYTNDKIGDFYAGTQLAVDTTDRNLYIMGMKLNGGASAGSTPWEIDSNNSKTFYVTAGSDSSGGSSGSSSPPSSQASSSATSSDSGSSQSSDNASITSTSLSSDGSSSGGSSGSMSFVAPQSTSSSSSDSTGGSNSSSSGSSDQSSSDTMAAVTSSSGQSTNDWSVPAATSSSDNTSSTRSWHGHWSGDSSNWHAQWLAAHGQG